MRLHVLLKIAEIMLNLHIRNLCNVAMTSVLCQLGDLRLLL